MSLVPRQVPVQKVGRASPGATARPDVQQP